MDTVQAGIVVLDAETFEILEANPAALRILRARSDQVIGTTCQESFCPSSQGHCPVVERHETVENAEEWLLTWTGEKVHVLKTVRQVELAGRRLLIESFVDITDRKQIEEKVRAEHREAVQAMEESRQLLRLVLDSIPIRVFWKDRNSVYLGCNRAFARDAGVDCPEDIVGRNDQVLPWHDAGAKSFQEEDAEVMASHEARFRVEEPHLGPEGEQRWLDIRKIPLCDTDGRVVGVLGTYEDVTRPQAGGTDTPRSQGGRRRGQSDEVTLRDAHVARNSHAAERDHWL